MKHYQQKINGYLSVAPVKGSCGHVIHGLFDKKEFPTQRYVNKPYQCRWCAVRLENNKI